MTTGTRRGGALRKLQHLAWAGLAVMPAIAQPALAEPPAPRPLPTSVNAGPTRRVVAFIHGNVPVYRDELGDYLIARGGMEKVELLVNRRVIEAATARLRITVTPDEIEAGLNDDLRDANDRQIVRLNNCVNTSLAHLRTGRSEKFEYSIGLGCVQSTHEPCSMCVARGFASNDHDLSL